jgi:AcrR family transcriptional regulator
MAGSIKMKSSDRREHILAEALKLFARHGMDQVTTRKIAEAVGISQPSLYAHFASRDEIAIELSRRAFGRLRERMEKALAQGNSTPEQLRLMGREYVLFGLEESDAYRVAFMMERANLAPDHEAAIHATGMHGFSLVHAFFRDVRRVDDERTSAIAQSAWAGMHGLVSLLLARPDFPWADQDKLIEVHLDWLCASVID